MLRPVTSWRSRSPAADSRNGELSALGQILPPRLHGDLVRRALLSAAAFRLPRHVRGPRLPRALPADGAQALLGHHDPGGGAHHRARPVAVAPLGPPRPPPLGPRPTR